MAPSSGRSVDLSVSGATLQYVVAGFVSLFVVATSAVAVVAAVGVDPGPVALGATVLVAWVALTVAWVRRSRDPDEGSAWGAIPRWQYGGRFVESGGTSRAEQEDSLPRSRNEK